MKHHLIITAAALMLMGCEPSELRPVAVGGGAVGTRAASQPAEPIAPGAHRIDDPDQPIENVLLDYVWGDTEVEAARRCRELAASAGVRYNSVKRTSRTGSKWECNIQSNHPEPEPQTDDRRQ